MGGDPLVKIVVREVQKKTFDIDIPIKYDYKT